MGEKRVTIYENDAEALRNGHVFNHAKEYAYVDEDSGDITFTDSAAPYSRVTRKGHIDLERGTGSGNYMSSGAYTGGNAGDLVAFGLMFFAIVIFIVAIPISWKQLFEDFDEFPAECTLMVITAIISMIVAVYKGLEAGIITSAVVATLIEMGISLYNGDGVSFWHFTIFPIVFAGFGVIPSVIGFVIKKVKDKFK